MVKKGRLRDIAQRITCFIKGRILQATLQNSESLAAKLPIQRLISGSEIPGAPPPPAPSASPSAEPPPEPPEPLASKGPAPWAPRLRPARSPRALPSAHGTGRRAGGPDGRRSERGPSERGPSKANGLKVCCSFKSPFRGSFPRCVCVCVFFWVGEGTPKDGGTPPV